jgi:shikimate dehydrogenase
MSDGRKAACVIGWPAGHSRSPLIHNYWIKRHNLNAEYRIEAMPPNQFGDFVTHLRDHGYVGCNVTVPYKQATMDLSVPDERAKGVGAANTLWLDGDTLRATNTDVEGFLNNLDAATPGWARGLESAMVLGAGGAARAVVFALIQRDVQRIYVINRTPERAEELRKQFGSRVYVAKWEEITGLLGGCGLLVNTTVLGMADQPQLEINLRCPDSLVVADLVYVPLKTGLLAAARDRGLRTADGLGMLLHQAVRGFELWFGVKPEVTPELRTLIEADLQPEDAPEAQDARAGAKLGDKAIAKAIARKSPKAPRRPGGKAGNK